MQRRVWRHGTVSAVGFGAMSFGGFYGPTDEAEIDADAGARARSRRRFLGHRQRLRRRALRAADRQVPGRGQKPPRQVTLATKFAIRRRDDGARFFDNSPAHIREALDGSRKRLGVDHIDLYYVHRVDKSIPIEDTVGELGAAGQSGRDRRDRPLGGRARHAEARSRGASDRRRPVGIFAVDAQSRTRPHSGLRGGGRASGRVLAARARLFQRPAAERRDIRRQGFPPRQSALSGPQLAAQPRPARRLSRARQVMGREARDAWRSPGRSPRRRMSCPFRAPAPPPISRNAPRRRRSI